MTSKYKRHPIKPFEFYLRDRAEGDNPGRAVTELIVMIGDQWMQHHAQFLKESDPNGKDAPFDVLIQDTSFELRSGAMEFQNWFTERLETELDPDTAPKLYTNMYPDDEEYIITNSYKKVTPKAPSSDDYEKFTHFGVSGYFEDKRVDEIEGLARRATKLVFKAYLAVFVQADVNLPPTAEDLLLWCTNLVETGVLEWVAKQKTVFDDRMSPEMKMAKGLTEREATLILRESNVADEEEDEDEDFPVVVYRKM